jgi:hypothetical protein
MTQEVANLNKTNYDVSDRIASITSESASTGGGSKQRATSAAGAAQPAASTMLACGIAVLLLLARMW